MAPSPQTPGIVGGRLSPEALAANFADIAPPLTAHEALVAADRCYFCYDAPCVTACPTSIDIPLFIREIASGVPEAAARTILSPEHPRRHVRPRLPHRDPLRGGLRARGRRRPPGRDRPPAALRHRHPDGARARSPSPRAEPTGRRVAVVGAGPAGLACAHRLAMLGHEVTLLDGREKPGGLNEFGIAAYKAVDGFAQAEVAWLLGIGGIDAAPGRAPRPRRDPRPSSSPTSTPSSSASASAASARSADASGGPGVRPAVDFIAELRQAGDLAALPVGRRVVVIGGGMTAIDAGVQSKKLGAEEVTIAYRRGRDRMGASAYEQELATSAGVRILANAAPLGPTPAGMAFAYSDDDGTPGPERFEVAADQILTAIGQTLDAARRARHRGRQDRRHRPRPHQPAARLGRRRLRLGRRRPHGDRRRRGPRRRHGHPRNAAWGRTGNAMADLRSEFVGIKSPNPFWLASAPPTNTEYKVHRAFDAGWGGAVWKTLGLDPIVNVNGPRYGAIDCGGPAARSASTTSSSSPTARSRRTSARSSAVKQRLPQPRRHRLADGRACDEATGTTILHAVEDDRRRRPRAQLRLPARHERARHGLRRRPGAGVHRDDHRAGARKSPGSR